MRDTTIRVKDGTYRSIVKARGAFEQTFGAKLTLDETMYLASSYISIAYEELQNLIREDLLEIIEKNGKYSVRVAGLDQITQRVLPRLITAFKNFQALLEAKGEQKTPLSIIGGQVS